MLIWKSSSLRVFHEPDRKSWHQANALPLVSRSTSSVLPPWKDSASESSSHLAPNRGLGVLNDLPLTTSVFPTRFFSTGGAVSSVVEVGAVPRRPAWSAKTVSSLPQLVTSRIECIVSFWAKCSGGPVCNVGWSRQAGLVAKHSWPVKLLNRKSFT